MRVTVPPRFEAKASGMRMNPGGHGDDGGMAEAYKRFHGLHQPDHDRREKRRKSNQVVTPTPPNEEGEDRADQGQNCDLVE